MNFTHIPNPLSPKFSTSAIIFLMFYDSCITLHSLVLFNHTGWDNFVLAIAVQLNTQPRCQFLLCQGNVCTTISPILMEIKINDERATTKEWKHFYVNFSKNPHIIIVHEVSHWLFTVMTQRHRLHFARTWRSDISLPKPKQHVYSSPWLFICILFCKYKWLILYAISWMCPQTFITIDTLNSLKMVSP